MLVGIDALLDVALDIGHHGHLNLERTHKLCVLENHPARFLVAIFFLQYKALLVADHETRHNRFVRDRTDALLCLLPDVFIPVDVETTDYHVAVVELLRVRLAL